MRYKAPFKTIIFEGDNDFEAYRKAEKWVKENGYSAGSMCSPSPTAIFKGDCYVAKWRNLSVKERNSADGYITSVNNYRSGPVELVVYNEAN